MESQLASRFDRYMNPESRSKDYDLKFLQRESKCCKFNVILIFLIFLAGILALIAVLFFWQNKKSIEVGGVPNAVETVPLNSPVVNKKPNVSKRITEPLISSNTLLTYLITKRKICLFEVSTLQPEESR